MKHTVEVMAKILTQWQDEHGSAPVELRVSPDVSREMSKSVEMTEEDRKLLAERGITVPVSYRVSRLITEYGDTVQVTVDPELNAGEYVIVGREIRR